MYSSRLTIIAPALLALAVLLGSCRKPDERDQRSQERAWQGTWQVTEIRTTQTDTLGRVLSTDIRTSDLGRLELLKATGDDDFMPARFFGGCRSTELVGYFGQLAAGTPLAPDGYELYWEADPEGQRLFFWAVGPASSYHRIVNTDGDGKSERELYYVIPANRRQRPNLVTHVAWRLRK